MTEFRVSVDLRHMIPPEVPVLGRALPRLKAAVESVGAAAQHRWMEYAGGKPLPNGAVIHSRTGKYLQSIQRASEGDFATRVFSDAPYSEMIENGTPARDLKRMLDTSMKVRVAKDGSRYLIIPFRWGTPGTTGFGRNVMPQAVHELWKSGSMEASRVTGMGVRPSGTGAFDVRTRQAFMVPARRYRWGDRLSRRDLNEVGVFGEQAKRMSGMVQMRNPGGQGGSRHSQYLTFRVMSERSSGWLAPAIPGRHPAREVAREFEEKARRVFAMAARRDIESLLRAGPES
jgi:hypothetical protein